ncbi:MAG: DUF3108 domain-containing protein [Paracoccaceae bacterium]|nr:DUF3108 domain-containing protein [Paracoccaceae bacterium]MDE3240730.1 DUF3108 domain-containing protein [Paracoccaceae bacterium]
MPLCRRQTIAALSCAALLLQAAAVRAAAPKDLRDYAVYDFYVKGFRAGMLVFAGVQAGDYYAVNGRFSSAGLMSLFRNVTYSATVRGTIAGGTYRPETYVLTTDAGKDHRVQTITYTNGVPAMPVEAPPHQRPPEALNPATQGGTLDTLTALYATLREMPQSKACNGSLTLFDGTRRAKLTLWPGDGATGTLACAGEYRRVAGYDAKDMEHPVFPFRMTYAPTSNGQVQVTEIDMQSIYGPAKLKRR